MGLIISRFRRKKTTTEILERIESKIKTIEQDGQCKEQTHKRVIGYVMAYSVGLYVLFAILYYFMYVGKAQNWMFAVLQAIPLLVLPILYVMAYSVGLYVLFAILYYFMYVGKAQNWMFAVLQALPLLVLPILVIFLRSSISWYYNWTLNKNRIKLTKMKEEKKKILEQVMNTETYKIAKEILDKYGGIEDQSKALKPFIPTQNVPGNSVSSPLPATPGQLRQRQLALTSTPLPKPVPSITYNNTPALYNGSRLRSDQLPRPILDQKRSALEKVVDYLLKDGPNHRMALICTECFSHNGMAMAEEFEYVSYVCAYCGKLNPARKQRPAAPALNYTSPILRKESVDETPVASSGSDTEDEQINRNNVTASPNLDDSDRPPSPKEEAPKSNDDKKQD